jgi:lipopolysaccharide/colanic/teichoic acid biosynthesis glycosyltransferase
MSKRLFDVLVSLAALAALSPLLLVLAAAVACDGRGGALFVQRRIGRHGKPFGLIKFRTMKPGAEKAGQLTVGSGDARITATGRFLRKYKLDELPQLLNVLAGTMSLVGPRPEVPRYVARYDEKQRGVLAVRPGLSDYASIEFADENDRLAAAADPEREYVERILPRKLELGLRYIREQSFWTDLRILARTFRVVFIRR